MSPRPASIGMATARRPRGHRGRRGVGPWGGVESAGRLPALRRASLDADVIAKSGRSPGARPWGAAAWSLAHSAGLLGTSASGATTAAFAARARAGGPRGDREGLKRRRVAVGHRAAKPSIAALVSGRRGRWPAAGRAAPPGVAPEAEAIPRGRCGRHAEPCDGIPWRGAVPFVWRGCHRRGRSHDLSAASAGGASLLEGWREARPRRRWGSGGSSRRLLPRRDRDHRGRGARRATTYGTRPRGAPLSGPRRAHLPRRFLAFGFAAAMRAPSEVWPATRPRPDLGPPAPGIVGGAASTILGRALSERRPPPGGRRSLRW